MNLNQDKEIIETSMQDTSVTLVEHEKVSNEKLPATVTLAEHEKMPDEKPATLRLLEYEQLSDR
jgi:hypothetical protein